MSEDEKTYRLIHAAQTTSEILNLIRDLYDVNDKELERLKTHALTVTVEKYKNRLNDKAGIVELTNLSLISNLREGSVRGFLENNQTIKTSEQNFRSVV